MKEKFFNERGVTLVEMLIAIVVLAVGVIAVAGTFPVAYRAITKAGRVSTLTHFGYQKIDQLKMQAVNDWGHSDLDAGNHPTVAAERMVTGYPDYSVTWEIIDDEPVAGMKAIVVEVGLNVYDANGNPNSPAHPNELRTEFVTYVSE